MALSGIAESKRLAIFSARTAGVNTSVHLLFNTKPPIRRLI
jgi:hypothetical protein